MKREPELPQELVGVPEIARLLGVPEGWVYDQVAKRIIPHRKVGKYLRFNPRTVLTFYPEQGGSL